MDNLRKELDEEFKTKFDAAPYEIQRDAVILLDKARAARSRMVDKLVLGKSIPDSYLTDLRIYYECYASVFGLLLINVEPWNLLERQRSIGVNE